MSLESVRAKKLESLSLTQIQRDLSLIAVKTIETPTIRRVG